ncbi:hypothetical protein M0804_003221 [Polistes exclamans]|nr:hypothetical protein M0804_003221 [Polistes exclamans]
MKFHVLMEEFNALKLKIIINDENTRLHFYPIKIKIPYIQLENLGLLSSLITEFQANDNGIIDLSKYCKSVYILPSMKTVRLVSVSKKIPSNCPFANYNELRKYWIDMNGYYLPETEDGIIYYEVKFHASKGDNFIYPSICVVKGPFQYIPCKDGNSIISHFIHDLCNTFNKVCDKQLYIYNSNKEINHRLNLSDEVLKIKQLNTSKVDIPNKNVDMIDKNCSQQLGPTIRYECGISINFS